MLKIWLLSSFLTFQLLIGSTHVFGQEATFNNFADGVADGWVLEPGWRLETDERNSVLGGEGHSWARIEKGADWTNFSFRFGLKLIRGGIHLNYRVSDEGRYFIGLREDGFYLNKETPWGKFFELAVSDTRISFNVWHDIEIRGDGGHIQVYVDGLLEIDVIDEIPLTKGSIAFETLEESYAYVDNVEAGAMQVTPEIAGFFEEHPVWNMPDLAVASFFVEPDRANPGETVFLRATVSNSGTGITEPAKVVFLVDNIEVGHTAIGPLESSIQANVRAAWVADTPGHHRAITRLELGEDIFDQDSRNNLFEAMVRVSGEENPQPELEVTLVDSDSSKFLPGVPYDIMVKVRNPGFAGAENIRLMLYIDEENIASETIEYLAPGKNRTFKFHGTTLPRASI